KLVSYIHLGPAEQLSSGSDRQSFQYVGSAAQSAIEQHRTLALHRVYDFRQSLDRRWSAFEVTASVIGDHDARCAMFDSELGVLRRQEPFDDHRNLGMGSQLFEKRP